MLHYLAICRIISEVGGLKVMMYLMTVRGASGFRGEWVRAARYRSPGPGYSSHTIPYLGLFLGPMDGEVGRCQIKLDRDDKYISNHYKAMSNQLTSYEIPSISGSYFYLKVSRPRYVL